MNWWQRLMARLGWGPSSSDQRPPPVEKELQQVTQKIEVTIAAKAQAEHAAAVTGEPDLFRPVIEEKAVQLYELDQERVILLERQRELIARQHRAAR
jgi:hypothetical protein